MGPPRVKLFCPKNRTRSKQATSKWFQTVASYDQVVNCHRAVADCCQVFFPKLLRCSEEPVINLLTRCHQIVKKQVNVSNFFVSAFSPSSVTLIKFSSSHSVSDKARQWLDQSPIKKKRSWPCTTWRYTGRHCASKSCNWVSPSLLPLRKKVTFVD